MRKFLLLAFFICLLNPPLGLASLESAAGFISAPAANGLTPEEMRADFDLMRKALEEAHTGLYRYSTKAEMDRAFDAQRAKLNRSMTKVEFYALVTEMLAKIRCGHTGMTLDDETRATVTNTPMFPLRVLIEGERLRVIFNDTPADQTIRPGMEIIEINGRKAKDILNSILSRLPCDGDIETCRRTRLQQNFARNYWLFIEQATEFTVKAKDEAGKTVTTKMPGVIEADRAKNQNPVNAGLQASLDKLNWAKENLSVRFLKDPEIAQIRIRGFGGRDYMQWIENTFKMLREKGTRVLILDLRSNGGGADMYGAMLVSCLTDKPFRYFDHINVKTVQLSFKEHAKLKTMSEEEMRELLKPNPAGGYLVTPKGHPGVTEQPPGKYPFMGKVMVLIDGGTFSTAADFCAVAHHLKRATFIGEETGGGYYGNNSGLETTLTLPNTKAQIRLPMYEYWNAVPGYDGKRRGTRPDHVVETKVANLVRGIDEQLNLALKLADQELNKR
ncbi:MAG TPA: S41 family peptidase [Blastocatellia bacterium]